MSGGARPGPLGLGQASLFLYRSTNIAKRPNPIFGGTYMMPAGTPILVLKEGTRRERGKGAQFNNIAAAKAVADAVRSTLGPRGMDKMLVDSLGDVVITNDGVTILKEIDIDVVQVRQRPQGAPGRHRREGGDDGRRAARRRVVLRRR